jgi:hypothetical protein
MHTFTDRDSDEYRQRQAKRETPAEYCRQRPTQTERETAIVF